MTSITSWTRLEPRARADSLAPGLQARVHDPLWLLARQWQLAEFTGEDAGSPALVRLRLHAAPVTMYRPGGGPVQTYDPTRPLEATVEAEPGPYLSDLRHAAETGLQFLRMLADRPDLAGQRDQFIATYPLVVDAARRASLDADSLRWLSVMEHRVPSGARLLPVMQQLAAGGLPTSLAAATAEDPKADPGQPLPGPDPKPDPKPDPGPGPLPGPDPNPDPGPDPLVTLATDWLSWLNRQGLNTATPPAVPAEPPAWQPARLEYRFDLAARSEGTPVTLAAAEYDGGRLDWYSFDVDTAASVPAPGGTDETVRTMFPAPVAYPGMPAARWWEFEDARVDFGRIQAEPIDLARLLLVEFATIYSNDWYVVPLSLRVASVVHVRSLVVTDTFGISTLVRPAGALPGDGQDWSLFRLGMTGPGAAAAGGRWDRLFLSPALPSGLAGEPVEEVHLFRDEMANLAWAVEPIVESATGRPVHRAEVQAAARPATTPTGPAGEETLRYRLMTTVPEHWFPLLPVEPTAGAYQLNRVTVPHMDDGEEVRPQPHGRILRPGQPLLVHEEEVPREGIRVTRARQVVRWTDGSTHTWIGRRKQPGAGEGSAGLQFDAIDLP